MASASAVPSGVTTPVSLVQSPDVRGRWDLSTQVGRYTRLNGTEAIHSPVFTRAEKKCLL